MIYRVLLMNGLPSLGISMILGYRYTKWGDIKIHICMPPKQEVQDATRLEVESAIELEMQVGTGILEGATRILKHKFQEI